MKDRLDDKVLRFYREDITSKYIAEFKKKDSNKKKCLKEPRLILKKYFWQSLIFEPTKLVILKNPTYLLSNRVLRSHLKMK